MKTPQYESLTRFASFFLITASIFTSFAQLAAITTNSAALKPAWQPLLDEKLSAWEIYMGAPHKSVVGLPEGTPMSPDGHEGVALGLNNDPKHVFSVKMENGEPVLCISGEILGALSTRQSYSNYHFRAEIKWGERKFIPRLNDPRDSGILYNCTGPHGGFWNVWKRSLEFQVQEKDMGDLFCDGPTCAQVRATRQNNTWFYDPAGESHKAAGFKTSGAIGGRVGHLLGDFEKPNGEWNTLDLYTFGRTAVHMVNGHVVLVLQDAGYQSEDKVETPLNGGPIQIQCEGAELFYRRIAIQPIKEIPAELLK